MVTSNIMSSIAYVLTFLCITTVISASRQPAPAPEANSPIPAPAVSAIPSPNPEDRPPIASPVPSADSPETNFPPSIAGVFDVTEHGAEPDGGTESSSAFLAAWKAACSHEGDSTFYIPEGKFLLGPVSFSGPCYNNQPPNIVINGALVALAKLSAFPDTNWIVFQDLSGINLTGGNRVSNLDGQGEVEAWKQNSCSKSEKCKKLITSLRFSNVSHGTISNITVSNGKGFHVGLHSCDNIHIHNVSITAPGDSPNTDGIHVSHSTNISITSSTIKVGDDCVSIGPGSRNISVSDVKCGPGHGISIGSLGKYSNEEDVVGVNVRNCTINGTQNGVRIKTWPGAPASTASNFTFEDIVMNNVSNPIIIDQEYCPSHSCKSSEPSGVKLKNIYFKNIRGSYNSESGATLLCSSGVPCENVHLVDINLNSTKAPEKLQQRRQGRFNVKGVVNGLEIHSSNF